MILEDLLIQSGTEYKKKPGNRDEVLMRCPFCTGQSDTSGDRVVFGLNLENGKAHCFRCDWKSDNVVYTARSLCEAWDIDFGWRLRLSAAEADVGHPGQDTSVPEPIPMGLPDEYERFGDLRDEIERKAFRFLRGRGITRDDIDEYQIGYAAAGTFGWRILFPVIGEDGVVYGCAGRDFGGQDSKKYRNTEGIKILYNAQHKAHTAVVVEGPVDTVVVNRVLRSRFRNMIGVGTLGSALTHQQLAQLAKFPRVINFPDSDPAGVKGAMSRADACKAAGIDTMVIEPEYMDGSDPGSMNDDEITERIRSARQWTGAQKLRMRLALLR